MRSQREKEERYHAECAEEKAEMEEKLCVLCEKIGMKSRRGHGGRI